MVCYNNNLIACNCHTNKIHHSNIVYQPQFSASDHIYVSTRVAKHFPGLFESAIVLSYKNPLPNNSGLYWGRVRHANKHTLRSRRHDIDNSTVHPSLDVTRTLTSTGSHKGDSDGGGIGGMEGNYGNQGPEGIGAYSSGGSQLRQLIAKRSIQTVVMSGEEADSFSVRVCS